MKTIAGSVVGCLIVGVALYLFVGPNRAQVAKDKVLGKIDDMLGKMDVQKAEIDAGLKSAKQAVAEIRRAKHQAQAQLDLIDEKVRPHQENKARHDEALAKLRDAINADKPADFAGKSYSVAELKGMAGKFLQARKESEEKIKGFDAARTNMRNVVATISKKQEDLETRIVRLEATHAKLDAEMVAARAMKKASEAMGDSGATLGENLDELVAKLRELGIESAADLKKSPRGQRLAENLAKIAAEIEGMDSQLASIDTELLKARSIVRRMEREQAGISDDEMRTLSQQLREVEARTDAAPRPINPLDVGAALEAALKGKKSPSREKR